MTLTKRCPRCGQHKPATLEYFHSDTSRHDGLRSWCKLCINANWREREKPTEKRNKTASEKEKASVLARKWREKNRERKLAKDREWYNSNKQRKNETVKRYRDANPEKGRISRVRRRARKISLPDTLTVAQWQRCLEYWGGCCAYCGRPAGFFHVIAADHFIALTDPNCPGTVVDNILPACHLVDGCNNQKHAKPAAEWLESKFGPRKAKQILKRIEAYFASVRTD